MENILELHHELKDGSYKHGGYKHFKISDPKPRDIHKATVRDRLTHHAVHRQLYPYFDRRFIADSFSCRRGKGTHRAMNRFRTFAFKVSRNHTRTCYVLKCDIRKFFAPIDQSVLMEILGTHIRDSRLLGLVKEVVGSFDSGLLGKGLPLGNLTSQLLVNIYMNEFDQFVKHELKARFYIRYADDFVILSPDRQSLVKTLRLIKRFLQAQLKLELHPDKVFIKTFSSGVDFLGWVHFSDHQVLRTATKRRMWRRVGESKTSPEVLVSYLGLLKHGNTYKLQQQFPVDFE